MVHIKVWEDFRLAVEALYEKSPDKVSNSSQIFYSRPCGDKHRPTRKLDPMGYKVQSFRGRSGIEDNR